MGRNGLIISMHIFKVYSLLLGVKNQKCDDDSYKVELIVNYIQKIGWIDRLVERSSKLSERLCFCFLELKNSLILIAHNMSVVRL